MENMEFRYIGKTTKKGKEIDEWEIILDEEIIIDWKEITEELNEELKEIF